MTDSRIEHVRRNRSVAHCRFIWLGSALLHVGCLIPGTIEPSPWTYSEQQQEILKLAPVGTSREEVVDRLKKAGIDGTFGVSDTVYYCDIWNRPGGERWHLNVALYFDDEGLLYDSRLAQAETGLVNESQVDPSLKTGTPFRNERESEFAPKVGDPVGRSRPSVENADDDSHETSARRGVREPFSKQAF
ncbi:MAG: hypothetical protein ACKVT0_00395 [Planctomycetaceae bacterium]